MQNLQIEVLDLDEVLQEKDLQKEKEGKEGKDKSKLKFFNKRVNL